MGEFEDCMVGIVVVGQENGGAQNVREVRILGNFVRSRKRLIVSLHGHSEQDGGIGSVTRIDVAVMVFR
jgi:hypothetical protein